MTRMTLVTSVFAVITLGCGGDSPSGPQALVVLAQNQLITPVMLASEGRSLGSLAPGVTREVTITGSAVEWTRGPVQLPDGQSITDDLTAGSVVAPFEFAVVPITNIVGGQTFIAPTVSNSSGIAVSLGIVTDGVLRCIATIPSVAVASAFVGYYRLAATTEVRIFLAASCTGEHVALPYAELSRFETGSGRVRISVSARPA